MKKRKITIIGFIGVIILLLVVVKNNREVVSLTEKDNFLCDGNACALSLTLLTKDGGRVAWYDGTAHDLVAFDAIVNDENKNTELFLMNPDGTNRICVTCNLDLRKGFIGQPAWHPDGEHIVIQVENDNSKHRALEHVSFGINNDLWIVSKDGKNLKRLWESKLNGAILHPHFSPDGKTLIFAERVATGKKAVKPINGICSTPGCENHWDGWQIRVAQFDSEKMEIVSSYTIQPSGTGFYETNNFLDNEQFTYSYTKNGNAYVDDLFSVNIDGSDVVQLLKSPTTWDEHGKYSPDEKYFIFQSSRGDETWVYPKSRADSLSTELYLQNVETGGIRQLTNMNERDDYDRFLVSDYDWSRDGNQIIFQVAPMNNRGSQVHPEIWSMQIDEYNEPIENPNVQNCIDRGFKKISVVVDGKMRSILWKGPEKWNGGAIIALHGGGGNYTQWCYTSVPIVKPQVDFSDLAVERGFAVFLLDSTSDAVTDANGLFCGKRWDATVVDGRTTNVDLPFIEKVITEIIPNERPDGSSLSVFVTGESTGGYMATRVATHFDGLITAFAPAAAGDPYGTYFDCDPALSVRSDPKGAGFDRETNKRITEPNACLSNSYPNERDWETMNPIIKPTFKTFHHTDDWGVNITCQEKISSLLEENKYPNDGDFVIPSEGWRNLAAHFWQAEYNEPILDFFEKQNLGVDPIHSSIKPNTFGRQKKGFHNSGIFEDESSISLRPDQQNLE